jgi:TolB-like protein
MHIIHEIRERKLAKSIIIYLSGSWIAIEGTSFFVEKYNWSPKVFDTVIIVVIAGLFTLLIQAWFHGKNEARKVQVKELALYSVNALVVAWFLVTTWTSPADDTLYTNAVTNRDENSIAVLPFKSLSDEKENQYFADGTMDEILTHLSRISTLRVISRTSVERYRDSEKTVPQIAAELGVTYLLEGSAQKVGNQVKIIVQLINAREDKHLWSEYYTRNFKDIFDLQSELAMEIAEKLEANLSEKERKQIEKVPTKNLAAYEYYLQAKKNYHLFYDSENSTHYHQALTLYKLALDADPTFPGAYTGIARVVWRKNYFTDQLDHSWLDTVLFYCNQALTYDAEHGEAYRYRGMYHHLKGHNKQAIQDLHKALDIKPNNPEALWTLGEVYYYQKEFEKALLLFKKAEKLDHSSEAWQGYSKLGLFYLTLGDTTQAHAYLKQAYDRQPNYEAITNLWWLCLTSGNVPCAEKYAYEQLLNNPSNPRGQAYNALTLVFLKRYDKAKEQYQTYFKTLGDSVFDYSTAHYFALTLWHTGEQKKAREILTACIPYYLDNIQQANPFEIRYQISKYNLAGVYAFLHQKENAYRWLEELSFVVGQENLIQADPLFDNLKEDKKFRALIGTGIEKKELLHKQLMKLDM